MNKFTQLLCIVGAVLLIEFFGVSIDAAPVRERDPLLIGSKWKGKLSQQGSFGVGGEGPPILQVLLVITKRDGDAFEGELREHSDALKITYLVKGVVGSSQGTKGYAVSFESHDAKDIDSTSPLLGIPYIGTIQGKSLKGNWKLSKLAKADEPHGDFTLELID